MRVKRKNGLTDKQEKFAQLRASGKTQLDAYKEAYDGKSSDKVQGIQATRLEKIERVKARIAELQKQVEEGAILNLTQIQAELANMASDESKPDGVRLKAFDQLTRMQGGYTDNASISLGGNVALSQLSDTIDDILE